MALGSKFPLTVLALFLLSLSAAVLVYNAHIMYETIRFNRALAQHAFDKAGQHASIYGVFASAYDHQQREEFDQALKLYATIEKAGDARFRVGVKYNMANLYLKQAAHNTRNQEHDLVVPLVELAKQNYRDLLHRNSDDWLAKYNLERALQLLPDVAVGQFPDDVMPERSPEAAGAVEIYDQLP